MGIRQSFIRYLGSKQDNDEENSETPSSNSFYNSLKNLFKNFTFILYIPFRRNRAKPGLPLIDPSPRTSSFDPLLAETFHVSSQEFGSSTGSLGPNFLNESDIVELEVQQSVCCSEQHTRNKKRGQGRKKKNVVKEIDGVRWVRHYSNMQKILVVGDGDFSFSACLAVSFQCASNMIATSLDSQEFLHQHYEEAAANIGKLTSRGCLVMHGIDATEIVNHALLGHMTYDRMIFNFPFAGFFRNSSPTAKLKRHRRLVSMFLKNAKQMIDGNGEIHISHKTNGDHNEWKLESIASSHGLMLIEAVDFKLHHYPGYNTKYGFGGDGNFNCYPSKTFKFRLKDIEG